MEGKKKGFRVVKPRPVLSPLRPCERSLQDLLVSVCARVCVCVRVHGYSAGTRFEAVWECGGDKISVFLNLIYSYFLRNCTEGYRVTESRCFFFFFLLFLDLLSRSTETETRAKP